MALVNIHCCVPLTILPVRGLSDSAPLSSVASLCGKSRVDLQEIECLDVRDMLFAEVKHGIGGKLRNWEAA